MSSKKNPGVSLSWKALNIKTGYVCGMQQRILKDIEHREHAMRHEFDHRK